jgi:predicted DCC family thiol-disulfide oxidoreductase YuxK
MPQPSSLHRDMVVVYDGDCPVCSGYCSWMKGNSREGGATYVDGRSLPHADQVDLNLEQGMIVLAGDRRAHGAEAMRVLAEVSTHKGVLAAVHRGLFGSRVLAKLTYPVLRLGRRLLLLVLGRSAF